jgi:hypothetical protein
MVSPWTYSVTWRMSQCKRVRRYRLAKFVRRHKAPVIAAGLILLALIAGVFGTTFGLVRVLRGRANRR